MSEGKEKTQRRVYVLPTELVERIVAYQQSIGLSSEVEAARRLLDDALKQRDTFQTITAKLTAKLKEVRSFRDAAREVLADHPLVTSIIFSDDTLKFTLKNHMRIEVYEFGTATVFDDNDNIYDFDRNYEEVPTWASSQHPRPQKALPKTLEAGKRSAPAPRGNYDLDDDIPF